MKPTSNAKTKPATTHPLSEARATLLFGKAVSTGETPQTFAARVIQELKQDDILTPEGKLNPEIRKRMSQA